VMNDKDQLSRSSKMQNLTLQLTQVSPVKMKADSDATSNKGAGNAKDNDQMFASVLKKQLSQKEAQDKKQSATSANQRAELAGKSTSSNQLKKDTDTGKQGDVADDLNDVQINIKDAKVDIELVADESADSRKDIADAQASQDNLVAQMGLPVMLNSTPKDGAVTDLKNIGDELDSIETKDGKEIDLTAVVSDDESAKDNQTGKDLSKLQSDSRLANANTTESKKLGSAEEKIDTSRQKSKVNTTDVKEINLKVVDVKGATSKEFNLKDIVTKDQLPPAQLVRTELNVTAQSNVALAAAQQIEKTDQIAIGFGKPGWNQAVNQKIMWMVGAADHSATLTLNPPDLGPLQVVLKVGNDQVDTTFISDNPEVRQALQDGMTMLRDKMQESGLQLGNTNISSNEQSQRDFQQAAQNRTQQAASRFSETTESEAKEVMPMTIKQQVSNGLVDTFA
jgi:flagellar hook-length control protein FliK